MSLDVVMCTHCEELSTVYADTDQCPNCQKDGFLMWAEDNWVWKDGQWWWVIDG